MSIFVSHKLERCITPTLTVTTHVLAKGTKLMHHFYLQQYFQLVASSLYQTTNICSIRCSSIHYSIRFTLFFYDLPADIC